MPQRQDEMAPEVLISGYYGFGNPGDEAILASMAAALRRANPGVRITVLLKPSSEPVPGGYWQRLSGPTCSSAEEEDCYRT